MSFKTGLGSTLASHHWDLQRALYFKLKDLVFESVGTCKGPFKELFGISNLRICALLCVMLFFLPHFCHHPRFQWQQIPKMHYLFHISEDAKWLNPAACWCYPGEHFVGNHTRLAEACLSGLPPHMVPSTVAKKYQVGKHLVCLQSSLT